MSLEAGMFAYLSSATTAGQRVFPMGKRPQDGELPAITYALAAGPTTHYSHSGPTDHQVSYQFDCWAQDADGAMDLDAELVEALDGFAGLWGDYRVGSVFLSVAMDDYETDTGLYRRMRQAEVHYADPLGS